MVILENMVMSFTCLTCMCNIDKYKSHFPMLFVKWKWRNDCLSEPVTVKGAAWNVRWTHWPHLSGKLASVLTWLPMVRTPSTSFLPACAGFFLRLCGLPFHLSGLLSRVFAALSSVPAPLAGVLKKKKEGLVPGPSSQSKFIQVHTVCKI